MPKAQMRELTERQEQFLNAFRRVLERNEGVSPSLEELAAEMGVKKATAQGLVRRLLASGHLSKPVGSKRSLSLSGGVKR